MMGAVCSTTEPGAGLNLWKRKRRRPPRSQTRKTAKLIEGATEQKAQETTEQDPLPALTFYRLIPE